MFRRKKPDVGKLYGEELARALSKCPSCAGEFLGHRYAQVAITPIRSDNTVAAESFLSAFRTRDWNAAVQHQEFNPMSDAFAMCMLDCPHHPGALLLIRDPFELWDPWVALEVVVLTPDEGEFLRTHIRHESWITL